MAPGGNAFFFSIFLLRGSAKSEKHVKIEFSTISFYFPYDLACFPLVSDGPMVRDLCN